MHTRRFCTCKHRIAICIECIDVEVAMRIKKLQQGFAQALARFAIDHVVGAIRINMLALHIG